MIKYTISIFSLLLAFASTGFAQSSKIDSSKFDNSNDRLQLANYQRVQHGKNDVDSVKIRNKEIADGLPQKLKGFQALDHRKIVPDSLRTKSKNN